MLKLEYLQYVRGNFIAFGFWSGLRVNITLLFPLANRILNRKHFGKRLRGLENL